MRRRLAVHRAVLAAAALLFSFIPPLLSGLALSDLLSSDAEFYVALAAALDDEAALAEDAGFSYARVIKPGVENWLHRGVMVGARWLSWSPSSVSVSVSVISLVAFVLVLYELLHRSLRGRQGIAFLAALLSIIPIHAAGITTLGFQALGFLPRDTASVAALAILIWYFGPKSVKDRARSILLIQFVCGALCNVYMLVFAYLAEVLLLTEVLRDRRIAWRHLGYGVGFLAGAAPILIESALLLGGTAATDMEVLQVRHPYMLLSTFSETVLRGLRRELIYCIIIPGILWAVHAYGSRAEREVAREWGLFTGAAFFATAGGLVLEKALGMWAPHFPRASIFFLLGGMATCGLGLQVIGRAVLGRYHRAISLTAFSVVLLLQSNAPSIWRYLDGLHTGKDKRRELLTVASWLRQNTPPEARILAPSTALDDAALTLRAYAVRPVFFSYKDGGVAVLDGDLARAWLARYREQTEVINSESPEQLLSFMDTHDVDYAVLQSGSEFDRASSIGERVRYRGDRYIVLQR